MLAITTFAPKHWDFYAKLCVEKMVKLWPGPVRVYFEGSAPPTLEGIEARPLDSLDRVEFLKRNVPNRPGFLWDAKRFCHKVFAQLDAMKDGEPFWWIDADVAIFNKIDKSLLEQQDVVTFLGRNSYTETGLIGFNPKHEEFGWFEDRYRAMYTSGTILTLDYWTDCHAFDAAREGRGENLTPNGKGFDNVMRDSKFGPYMAHFKGPLKAELYRLGGASEISANL